MQILKIKIDENLPLDAKRVRADAGFLAHTVFDQHIEGTSDSTIIEKCRVDKFALLTLDNDFADIRSYPPDDFSGIIVLRLKRQDKNHVLDIIRRISTVIDYELVSNHLIIVTESGLRIRS